MSPMAVAGPSVRWARTGLILQVLAGRFAIIGFGAHCEMILDIGFADDRAGDQALSSQHRAVPGDTP